MKSLESQSENSAPRQGQPDVTRNTDLIHLKAWSGAPSGRNPNNDAVPGISSPANLQRAASAKDKSLGNDKFMYSDILHYGVIQDIVFFVNGMIRLPTSR